MWKLNPKKIEADLQKIVQKTLEDKMPEMRRRMDKVSDILYRAATTKRPMINAVGPGIAPIAVTGSKAKLAKMGARRISNPDALFGVPVRTGNLQRSIKRKTEQDKNKILVRVWADEEQAPYAKDMEYGTPTVAARPFLRPALDLNKTLIEKIIKQ